MKLSLSCRGWSGTAWTKLVNMAIDMRFEGIEPYNIFHYPQLTENDGPFSKQNIKATVRGLKNRKFCIPCLDSSCDAAGISNETDIIKDMIDLAFELGTPFVGVRVFHDDEERIRERLRILIPYAEKRQVTILIRTAGIYSDTARLRGLLESFATDGVAALWDMYHPFFDCGEDPGETIEHLGAYIKHVHLRDAVAPGKYRPVGEGALPMEDLMRALSSVDYDGFISMEWRPEWMPAITDPEVLFPYFVSYMEKFIHKSRKKSLYKNHDGTGEYVWKKDELINLTFSEVLDRLVAEFPDQYAFRYTTLDYTRTYEEFRRDVDDFARALVSLGVRPGCKVSVWATNIPEWFIAFWATVKIGAVLVTVNTAYKVHEIEYLLKQSDTHTLIMIESSRDSDYRASINELCPEIAGSTPGQPLHCKRLPFLRNVITVGFNMPGCLEFSGAMERKSLVPLTQVLSYARAVKTSDVANMQYTSGTTGFPKGVMLTHYNVINNGKCIGDRMGLSTADRMMIQVPMFHCFGMVLSMTASVTHGTTMCPLPYFSAKTALSCINQERITCFNGVPTMFIAMFNHPDYRSTDFSHMRTGIMAGAGCPPELMKRAAQPDEMNMTGIVSVYGQTESSPGSTMTAWTDDLAMRTETVGYAFPHVECKVVDPETGETLPDGTDGEFCSRGYNIMKGYYKMSRATKEAIDADGWLHSGDLARRLPDGTYLITGRLKDMIIRGGENIYPKEIEEFYYTHPAVSDVQVVAVPDEKYGEEAAACVILKDGESATEEELRRYGMERLATHKVPRYIIFVKEFPLNAAGKVLKYKMREDVARLLGK